MKAWLGNSYFIVTQKQLDELNAIGEKEYMKTSDRAKGLQAAIQYCIDQKCERAAVVVSKSSQAGEAAPAVSFAEMQNMIEAAVKKAIEPKVDA